MNATARDMRRKNVQRQSPAGLRNWVILCVVGLMLGLGGCTLTYETTKTPRAPTEQLLLAQAFKRSLIDAVAPVRSGQSVAVETTGTTADQAFASALVEKWLSRQGLHIPKDGKETLVARVTLDAFGTLQDQTFFGIPAISSMLIPFALPQLSLYNASRQRAHARLSVDFVDKQTGKLVASTPLYEGDAYYNQYTYLFVFSSTSSDLLPPLP